MKKGCFVGLAGLDILFHVDKMPKENNKAKANEYVTHIGGPAANAAITYTMLGGKATLITSIGDSPLGKSLKLELEEYGVEVLDVASGQSDLPSISSIAINDTNGSRTILSGQRSIIGDIDNEIFDELDTSLFCLSDCNLFELSKKTVEAAKNRNIPVVLDAGNWKDGFEFFMSNADYTIASSVCKAPYDDDLFKVAFDCGSKNVAITNGEKETKWSDEKRSGTIHTKRVKAFDTLAAGDIFHGAFCYYKFVDNLGFEQALINANEVATYSVMFEGPRMGIVEYLKNIKNIY